MCKGHSIYIICNGQKVKKSRMCVKVTCSVYGCLWEGVKSLSVRVAGLVNEAHCSRKETVFVA